jgi:hypothetical protein
MAVFCYTIKQLDAGLQPIPTGMGLHVEWQTDLGKHKKGSIEND